MKLHTIQQTVQHQVLAQALQQSLQILQMPLLDLKALLERELESNPVLEESLDQAVDRLMLVHSAQTAPDRLESGSFEGDRDEEENDFLSSIPQPPPSLAQIIIRQFNAFLPTAEEALAGEAIIGNLDEAGYLAEPIEEIAADLKLPVALVEKALSLVQQCEPIGIGARSLQECLLIQLKAQGLGNSLAARLVSEGVLDAVADRQQHHGLAYRFKVKPEEIAEAARKIASLLPRPGELASAHEELPVIVPDIIITKDREGHFQIELRDDELPSLRISSRYQRMLSDPTTAEEVRTFVRERIQSALGVLRGVQQRHQTMKRLAEALIQLQPDFLEHGLGALRPMTYKDAAEAIGRHPSTVARAVAQKYLECPAGLFALYNLFSTSVKSSEGDPVSAEATKAQLKAIVEREDAQNPLGDEELVQQLQGQGILIARRTVAKYRQQLHIPPTHQRRRKSLV